MFRLALLFSFAIVLCILPGGYAGPACTRKYYQTAQCVQKCQTRWGYPGTMMGTNRWGAVMQHVDDSSTAGWNAVIAQACGMSSTASTQVGGSDSGNDPGVAGAVGSNPDDSINTVALATTTSLAVFQTEASDSTSSTESSTSTEKKPKIQDPTPVAFQGTPAPPKPPATTTKEEETPKPTPTPDQPDNGNGSDDSGDSETSSSDEEQYLKDHNDFRAQHGADPLTWSDDLASKAQQWANGCVFKHSGGSLGPFGENLAAGTGDSYDIAAAIKSWTDESTEYDPNNPEASHFTQVVWKSTKQLGCALQECDGIFDPKFGKAKYVVCEYDPPGNFNNEFAQNVQV